MSTIELLRAARSLIAEPEYWCQGSVEDSQGRHCAVGAIGFLAGGSVGRLYDKVDFAERGDEQAFDAAWKCLDDAAKHLCGRLLVSVNDDLGHEAILRVFDEAIAELASFEALDVEFATA